MADATYFRSDAGGSYLEFAALQRNAFGQLQSRTDRNGGTTTFSYCDCGALESLTDPGTNTTAYHRDYLGRVTNILSAAGSVLIERDNLGQPFHVSSSWGLDLRLAHDYQGLLTGVTNPAGPVSWTVFDAMDLPVSVTDARGVTVTNEFDGLGRLTYRYNAFGLVEYNTYSAQGISQHFDALWKPTSYGYDLAGRLAAITDANSVVTQVGYDPAGNIVSLTDGRNNTKWWAYDMFGRQIAETNANGVLVKTNGYDADGQLTAQWTAAKGLTQCGYDPNGNLLSIHYPHSTINYSYDVLNRLLTMSDGMGNSSFGYANFGAFKSALASETGPWATVTYGYSGPNLASISLGSWTESIGRDAALRPQTITSPAGAFSYSFSGAGRQLASLQSPGSTTAFGYDGAGAVNLIQVSGQSLLDYHGYDRDLNGLITGASRLNGVTNSYGYDDIGQLVSAQAYETNGALRLNENLSYGYDASGNLASRINNTLAQTFNTDPLNQLVNVTRSGTLTAAGSVAGAVAALGVNGQSAALYSDGTFATTAGLTLRDGNNLFVTAGSNAVGTLVLSTISSNRLPVTVNFGYDLNGNLLGDGQRVFDYDDANELTDITVAGQWKTDFVYDGLGRRRIVRESTNSAGSWLLASESRLVYDRMVVLREQDASTVPRVTCTHVDWTTVGPLAVPGALGGYWPGRTGMLYLSQTRRMFNRCRHIR